MENVVGAGHGQEGWPLRLNRRAASCLTSAAVMPIRSVLAGIFFGTVLLGHATFLLAQEMDAPLHSGLSYGSHHASQLAQASPGSVPPAGVSHAGGAPVIANESIVIGELLELSLIDSSALNIRPAQVLARMRLRVACVQDVPPKLNLLSGKTGEVMEVYSKDAVPTELVAKLIRVKIVFRGDERNGSYWTSGLTEPGSPCS
jgi:hypothetical protein